jgi:AcrR family transcriptional regulator
LFEFRPHGEIRSTAEAVKKTANNSHTTRERVLEHACAVFAEMGFHDATVAEICGRAGANIASVNYYFGNKQNLYREVLQHTFQLANDVYPIIGGLAEDAPAEARLEAFITAFLMRSFHNGPVGHFQKILVHEFSHPGNEVEYVFEEVLRPQIDVLRAIIKDLLPVRISEERLRLCGMGVISLCAIFNYNKVARERFMRSKRFSKGGVEWLAQHITRFALAGIQSAQEPLPGDEK